MSFTATASISPASRSAKAGDKMMFECTITNTGSDDIMVLSVMPQLTNSSRPVAISCHSPGGMHAPGAPIPPGTDNKLPTFLKQQNVLQTPFTPDALVTPEPSSSLVVSGSTIVSGGKIIAGGGSNTMIFSFEVMVGGVAADSLTLVCPVLIGDYTAPTTEPKYVLPASVTLTITSPLG